MTDRITYRVMTANHLPQQWRDAAGLDGQDLVEVFTNVSLLRRIEAQRDVDNETGNETHSTGETGRAERRSE